MTDTSSGNYPLETNSQEIERLQSAAMAPDANTMFNLIVAEGWSCLDVGCGPCGVAPLLSQMVGNSGRVLGLDANAAFLEHARSPQIRNACSRKPSDWHAPRALLGAFAGVGADLRLARRLHAVARQAGLDDVQYRTFILEVRSSDPLIDYLPSTVSRRRA